MRALPASATALLGTTRRTTHVRVTLSSNRGGTAWSQVLTSWGSRNFVRSVEWTTDWEQPVGEATIVLALAWWHESLSPLMAGSRLNASRTLVDVVRDVRIETQIAPAGAPADADGDWTNAWEGTVSVFRVEEDTITLTCRDRTAYLQDLTIEEEQPPPAGTTNWYTALAWDVSLEDLLQALIDSTVMRGSVAARAVATAYTLGQVRRPATRNGYCYEVTTAGTSHASTTPTWPTTIGATVTDGTVTWTCYAELPELWVPVASSYAFRDPETIADGQIPWSREPLLDALQRLAAGARDWCVAYRYDDATSAWRLCLFSPTRDTSIGTSLPEWSYVPGSLEVNVASVRNVVGVVYSDATAGLQRKVATATDTTSLASYGRRYAEIAEDDTSAIDSASEAGTLAALVRDSLSRPWATVDGVRLLGGRLDLEPGDVVELEAGDLHRYWDSNLDVLLAAVSHSVGPEGAWTTIRGRQVSTVDSLYPGPRLRWARKETRRRGPTRFQTAPARALVVAYQSSAESIAASNEKKINFDRKRYDKTGDFTLAASTASTDASYFTAPATGLYQFSLLVILGSIGTGVLVRAYLEKVSGAVEVASASVTTIKTGDVALPVNAIVWLTKGDAVQAWAYHNDGGARSTVHQEGKTGLTVTRIR